MGIAPTQIDRMSLYQWAATVDGWNKIKSDSVDPPTAEEFEAAKRAHGDD